MNGKWREKWKIERAERVETIRVEARKKKPRKRVAYRKPRDLDPLYCTAHKGPATKFYRNEKARICARCRRNAKNRSWAKRSGYMKRVYAESLAVNMRTRVVGRLKFKGEELNEAVSELTARLEAGATCAYCLDALSIRNYSLDHRVPIARDGANSLENIQLTCKSCNFAKRAISHEEYSGWLIGVARRLRDAGML